VNDLRSIAALQARVYEFLEQQDETTLRSIVDGTVQLAIASADEAPAPAGSGSSADPAHALLRLASEQERRSYVTALGLTVDGLRRLAKQCKLTGYSRLNRAGLVDLLVRSGSDEGVAHVSEPVNAAPTAATSPLDPGPAASTAKSDVDAATIAARLRETETEQEGAAYLREQHLDREGLLAVAAELQLTRVDRLRPTELEKRVLKQAIGARRKFAGLRKW
jgi:hypothetical protein